jgi:nucleoside-diphosphate-sugar epimerase
VRLAKLARAAGVERFVYTSSCSVYGIATSDSVDEESPVNPQTPYAQAKVLVERDVAKLATEDFSPVFLRNATAYGTSPRMRFDIVLNNLSGHAWTIGEIRMDSDGTPWRPFVHILDVARAVACALDAPRSVVHNEIFNVGDSRANYRIREVAEIVGSTFPGCEVTLGELGADNRSYRVSFDKIGDALPGFRCDWTLEQGARQLRELFEEIDLSRETFEFRGFTRLKQLQYLIATKQLDDRFFWRNGAVH